MLLETNKFEFGDFLLDAKEKNLLRGGKPLQITPKAFQLLLVLIEKHGRLVEKDELMNAVWADSFVEEANLAFTVGLLRKALSDNAQEPRFIETVPKRGYRFIADVKRIKTEEEISDEHEINKDRSTSSEDKNFTSAKILLRDETSGKNSVEETAASLEIPIEIRDESNTEKTNAVDLSKKKRMFAALAAVLFLAVLTAFGFYFFAPQNTAGGEKKSIVVLPLKPINTAVRDELYEIGIADSLIHRLGSIKGFIVRPLSAIRKYADIEQDPLAAGKEQQVDYVLAANYQLAGGKIRVTAQLFNVLSGQIEETYKIEKDAGDIFAMQDAIAEEIGNILNARFDFASDSRTAKHGTANEEAYRLYLQGTYLFDKRNLADARKAIQFLEEAVRLDPNYALAWAGKAYAHRVAGNNAGRVDPHEEYRKSIEAINKALAIDENLAEAHSALCDNKMYYEYDFEGAERECRLAIELDPNSSLAHNVYSRFLNSRGRFDEAIREIKTAIDLEPASFHNRRNLGVSLYFARRYDEAVIHLKRVIEMDKNHPSTYFWLIRALEMQNRESESFEWFMKLPTIQTSGNEAAVQAFQKAYQTTGWHGVLRERAKRAEENKESYFQAAADYAQLGEKDKAFEYLEKAYARRELWIANLQVEPRLDRLRDDPRYSELVARVESKK